MTGTMSITLPGATSGPIPHRRGLVAGGEGPPLR